MTKKIRMILLAVKIEWNWFFIIRMRKKINRLVNSGEPFTSEKLITLDERTTRRRINANIAQKQYEDMAEITTMLRNT